MGEIICKLGTEFIHLLIHALRRGRERERVKENEREMQSHKMAVAYIWKEYFVGVFKCFFNVS